MTYLCIALGFREEEGNREKTLEYHQGNSERHLVARHWCTVLPNHYRCRDSDYGINLQWNHFRWLKSPLWRLIKRTK